MFRTVPYQPTATQSPSTTEHSLIGSAGTTFFSLCSQNRRGPNQFLFLNQSPVPQSHQAMGVGWKRSALGSLGNLQRTNDPSGTESGAGTQTHRTWLDPMVLPRFTVCEVNCWLSSASQETAETTSSDCQVSGTDTVPEMLCKPPSGYCTLHTKLEG